MLSNESAAKILVLSLLCSSSVLSLSEHSIAQSSHGATQVMAEKTAPVATSKEARQNLGNYRGQNGILSLKTMVLGGVYRVTTVVPFKGNIADYHRLEITQPISLVGQALGVEASSRQVTKIKSQFESRKLFESVVIIDSYNPALYQNKQMNPHDAQRAEDDPLEAPIRSVEQMAARDRERKRNEQKLEQPSTRTLVTVIEVLDYEKGSRLKQALQLDLGKSVLTVRLRYYDKATGQEIGRQIVSGQSDGSSLLGPLSPRDGLSAVVDGFVDQVTRRVASSVR